MRILNFLIDKVPRRACVGDPWSAVATAVPSMLESVINYGSQHQNRKLQRWITNETNQTSRDIADANNQMSYRMFQEGNEFNAQQQQKQNDFNSEVSQAARLRAAGINPALAMSAGAQSGMASSMSAPSLQQPNLQVPSLQAPQFDFSGAYESVSAALKAIGENRRADQSLADQLEALRAQAMRDFKAARKNEADARFAELNAQIIDSSKEALIGMNEATLEKVKAETELFREQRKTQISQQLVNDAQIKIGFRQLGINQQQADALCKYYVDVVDANRFAAVQSANATRYSADQSAAASRYASDQSADVARRGQNQDWLKFNQQQQQHWNMFCKELHLSTRQADAAIKELESRAKLNDAEMWFTPIRAIGSVVSLSRKY